IILYYIILYYIILYYIILYCDHIKIPQLTDNLFRERAPLHHPPRSLPRHPHSEILNSISLINFYDPFAPMEGSQNLGSIPPRAAELITKMNRHPRSLSLLGILPNQFRTLLKELGLEQRSHLRPCSNSVLCRVHLV